MIVDDVYTTGSTVDELARTLKRPEWSRFTLLCYVLEKAVEMVKREYARNRMCVILNLNLGIFIKDTGENTC